MGKNIILQEDILLFLRCVQGRFVIRFVNLIKEIFNAFLFVSMVSSDLIGDQPVFLLVFGIKDNEDEIETRE